MKIPATFLLLLGVIWNVRDSSAFEGRKKDEELTRQQKRSVSFLFPPPLQLESKAIDFE